MISIKKFSIKLPTDLAAGGGAPRTRKIMTNIYTQNNRSARMCRILNRSRSE